MTITQSTHDRHVTSQSYLSLYSLVVTAGVQTALLVAQLLEPMKGFQ